VESGVNTIVQTTTPVFVMENKRLNAQTAMGTIGWTTVAVQLEQEQWKRKTTKDKILLAGTIEDPR
jgi:hypothetical protein